MHTWTLLQLCKFYHLYSQWVSTKDHKETLEGWKESRFESFWVWTKDSDIPSKVKGLNKFYLIMLYTIKYKPKKVGYINKR